MRMHAYTLTWQGEASAGNASTPLVRSAMRMCMHPSIHARTHPCMYVTWQCRHAVGALGDAVAIVSQPRESSVVVEGGGQHEDACRPVGTEQVGEEYLGGWVWGWGWNEG